MCTYVGSKSFPTCLQAAVDFHSTGKVKCVFPEIKTLFRDNGTISSGIPPCRNYTDKIANSDVVGSVIRAVVTDLAGFGCPLPCSNNYYTIRCPLRHFRLAFDLT